MAEAFGMSVTAWSPLAGGVLSGKYNLNDKSANRLGKDNPMSAEFLTPRNLLIAQKVIDIAVQIGKTPSKVALKWLMKKGRNIIPIIGSRCAAQVQDNLGCLDIDLNDCQMAALDEISKIELGFPHDFLNLPFVKNLVLGDNFSKIQK